jgi:hypothetical protein
MRYFVNRLIFQTSLPQAARSYQPVAVTPTTGTPAVHVGGSIPIPTSLHAVRANVAKPIVILPYRPIGTGRYLNRVTATGRIKRR